MIKTGGVNVAPLEVEQSCCSMAYVVGIPDRSKGEIVAAAVELRGGAATDPAAIVAFCRERLASYKVPGRFAFRTAARLPRGWLPKTHFIMLMRDESLARLRTRFDAATGLLSIAEQDPRGGFFYITRKAWLDLGLPSRDREGRKIRFYDGI